MIILLIVYFYDIVFLMYLYLLLDLKRNLRCILIIYKYIVYIKDCEMIYILL